jgi:hypothetical protein
MPKLKPLQPAEFEGMAATLSYFLRRLGLTIAEFERAQYSKRGNGATHRTPTANGAASGSKTKRSRRRRHSPIDQAAVIAAVRAAGKSGAAAGDIAQRLRIDVGRLRPVLWQIRDDGQLKMSGKLSLARYHVARSATSKNAPAMRPAATKAKSSTRGRAKSETVRKARSGRSSS